MILVDTNLFVYAFVSDFPQHGKARSWLDRQLMETPAVGIPWQVSLAFLRIVTNGRIFERPPALQRAWKQVRCWLSNENVWIPNPGDLHAEAIERLLPEAGPDPNIIPDLHLAALAMEHGLELMSADRDFARFSRLRWRNPLDD